MKRDHGMMDVRQFHEKRSLLLNMNLDGISGCA
ncbi:BH1155 [Halalkalibacterium halodurans C-125]|jgi:hypothetical protein|uniref:BH1155 protein n=1 Tax=Halalkalibacterium halodurans (strain ATCC BAA-125 / DSM 18197 / FERM 7344 / JCM 9153 / C-125) TaxID=272558 RepID=Q9KDQ6_HALH5|nr:BH1155 [Halalkalibacterium halodurans C-125]